MKLTYVVSFSGQHLRVFVLCLAKDTLPVFFQLFEKENVFKNSLAKAVQKRNPDIKGGRKMLTLSIALLQHHIAAQLAQLESPASAQMPGWMANGSHSLHRSFRVSHGKTNSMWKIWGWPTSCSWQGLCKGPVEIAPRDKHIRALSGK